MNESSPTLNRMAARVAVALQKVNLDSAFSFWVANSHADACPLMQRSLREILQVEQSRREGTEIVGYALPAFDAWSAPDLLNAGSFIMGITEQSAQSGDPGLIDLAFRIQQLWLTGFAVAIIESEVH